MAQRPIVPAEEGPPLLPRRRRRKGRGGGFLVLVLAAFAALTWTRFRDTPLGLDLYLSGQSSPGGPLGLALDADEESTEQDDQDNAVKPLTRIDRVDRSRPQGATPSTAVAVRLIPTSEPLRALDDIFPSEGHLKEDDGPDDLILGRIRQLTFDACCPGAWWSHTGEALHYFDNPVQGAHPGVYALPVWPPGALPSILDTSAEMASSGTRFLARRAGDHSIVRDNESGLEWPIASGGNPVRIAPDGEHLVWWEAGGGRSQVDSNNEVFAADISGTNPRSLTSLWGGEVIDFLGDTKEIVVLGREEKDTIDYVLRSINVLDGSQREIARGAWLSEVSISPDGTWVAYMISLDES